ncbi:lipopolysaccharide export system permease protein [Luteimonas cucumeris]|uniref:Lipopolysaccharide export system permease protein n=1 Tax=Luteimonas cucumeris TaxID=985012 RepID=A0A562L5J5_9GAMM|nr:LPS export ABC transporter permease LptG [Luteimonas cucumeris]TWI02939.1 lipopolysaccharide export system permease protein [Luteimonas cucumeris]
MRPFPKLHDLYIGRMVLGTVLLTWMVLLGLDFIIGGLVPQFGDLGKGNYDFFTALTSVIYTVPRRAYTMFPTAAVIGSLMGLGQLAASSELTALRALGLSRRRLSLAVALSLSLLTALMVVNGETLAPWAQSRADAVKAAAKSPDLIVAQYSGLWAREGDIFLNAQTGQEMSKGDDSWLELRDVRLFEFSTEGRLQSLAHAAVAEHRPGGWLLRNVNRTRFEASSVVRTKVAEEKWESQLDSAALATSVARPRYLSASELKAGINYRKRNELDASEFEQHYWGRWFYPLNVLALCLAAMPFAFGSLRSGGLGKRLFLGIVFALGFWMLQEQSVRLAGAFKFDFRIAYLLPPVLMLAISIFLFRRRSG